MNCCVISAYASPKEMPVTDSTPISAPDTLNVAARPNSAIHSASRLNMAMIAPGVMPRALSMPNSGVRSKIVIRNALTMLKVTSTTSKA